MCINEDWEGCCEICGDPVDCPTGTRWLCDKCKEQELLREEAAKEILSGLVR